MKRSLVLAVLILASCKGAEEEKGLPGAGEIGPQGGEISIEGATLTVPEGALSESVKITFEETSDCPPGNVARAYKFGPEGLSFSKPVTIAFSYLESEIPAGISEEKLMGGVVDRDENKWSLIALSSCNAEQDKVTARVLHFSVMGIIPLEVENNACIQAGGECKPLVPGGCSEGYSQGDYSQYKCTDALGIMCCIPPAECTETADCTENLVCADGRCATVSCDAQDDCDSYGMVCSDTVCMCVGDGCLSDADCPDGFVCEFYKENDRCGTQCVPTEQQCVREGESKPVVPEAPECCEGLSGIGCGKPDENGVCPQEPCVGAVVCTKCGNGECGPGENKCNCQQDCAGECHGEGEGFESFGEPQGMCCEGLVAVPLRIPDGDGGCIAPLCPCYVCTRCGDGACGAGENECNCPDDCEAQQCIPEGGSRPVVPNAPDCCEGLSTVPCDRPDENGQCMQGCVGASYCTKCGNGECGPGENICNCPGDCGQACYEEGEGFQTFGSTEGMCCEGSKPIPDSQPQGDMCVALPCPCYVCANCGDGTCGLGENECNCPEDCGGQACYEEGEGFQTFGSTEGLCCEGLSAIAVSMPDDQGGCIAPICPCYLCTQCGDDTCGASENECNCPADCTECERKRGTCIDFQASCPQGQQGSAFACRTRSEKCCAPE